MQFLGQRCQQRRARTGQTDRQAQPNALPRHKRNAEKSHVILERSAGFSFWWDFDCDVCDWYITLWYITLRAPSRRCVRPALELVPVMSHCNGCDSPHSATDKHLSRRWNFRFVASPRRPSYRKKHASLFLVGACKLHAGVLRVCDGRTGLIETARWHVDTPVWQVRWLTFTTEKQHRDTHADEARGVNSEASNKLGEWVRVIM